MRLSIEWLRDFVNVSASAEEIAEKFSLSGNNIEEMISPFNVSGKIVAGKVIEVQKHPNADRLIVCKVDIGNEIKTIVTGDLSVKEGDIVPLALEGARLGDLVITPRKMRGILSEGMMCSLEELGLEEKSDSVYRFKEKLEPGTDIISYLKLDDKVLDVEITPNRPDCLSVIGLAREVSALFDVDLKMPKGTFEIDGDCDVSVEIESEGCWRYTARVVKGVKVEPSPLWLQRRLIAAGIRPINNVVDITNYVLLETGHPVHAFDLNLLSSKKIVVRDARKGEKILLLDGKEYELTGDEVLITDGERPLALAGIMGGEESGVNENTTDVLLEVAMFDPVRIRKTAKNHGIMSESSYRFERGVDPNDSEYVINRLSELLYKLAGGISTNIVDVYPKRIEPRVINYPKDLTVKVIGEDIDENVQKKILERLGFKVEDIDEKSWKITVPTFRYFDVERPIDIVEEISRIYGNDMLEGEPFRILVGGTGRTKKQKLRYKLKEHMISEGFSEAITLTFVSEAIVDRWNFVNEKVKIKNPINEEMDVVRPTLIYGLLGSLSYNYKRQNRDVKLFEIGKVFKGTSENPVDIEKIAAVAVGRINKYDYTDYRTFTFYNFKGIIDNLSSILRVKFEYKKADIPGFVPTRTAKVILNGKEIGFVGMVDPEIADKFYDVKDEIYVFELSTEDLYENYKEVPSYRESVVYPSVRRDVSFLVPKSFKMGTIIDELFEYNYVEEAGVSDIYTGKGIPEGFTSVTVYCVFRSNEKTLSEDEINEIWTSIKKKLTEKYPIKLRFEEV
ncbi:phenylalanine--tRNA ligase subunit beta [Thermosipho atlanticus]|uniref:Phenylalanine--tRNA ligase beta subunit n=1 Tax=Thermosipho atlanticus DSM 15807 TaxID=1123380 RepID=A0A1M5TAK0_9BACT|nr:phenylalanine--tRNA ligase subunit beta [Thermosipho atlanticus]SHH47752.1 phenylalanyl-tRNA synthetase beta subunit [Thermosipho atlanticus DSM 15807]